MRSPRSATAGTFLLLLTLAAASLAPLAGAAQAGVAIQQRAFVPPSLTVGVGDTVTWTVNRIGGNDAHSVTSGTPGSVGAGSVFDSGIVLAKKGDSFSWRFTKAGIYPYFCRVHPFRMTGTITVEAAPTSTPTPAPTGTPSPPPTSTPAPSGSATATSAPGASATPGPPGSPSPSESGAASSPAPSGASGPTASATAAPGGSAGPTGSPAAHGPREPVPGYARPAGVVVLILTLAFGGLLLIVYRRVNAG